MQLPSTSNNDSGLFDMITNHPEKKTSFPAAPEEAGFCFTAFFRFQLRSIQFYDALQIVNTIIFSFCSLSLKIYIIGQL